MVYIGRFAPSPTGSLHLGTLAAAVASFLHARHAGGKWLVRIEDIDPQREVPGAATDILRSLEQLELLWDGEVCYQSARLDRYRELADKLLGSGQAYYCNCSRQQIQRLTGSSRYPGTCRNRVAGPRDAAIRIRTSHNAVRFTDLIQGPLEFDIESQFGDFVIIRRDSLPAYHLAVVVDDAEQGITDVVRGADLLASTPLHIHLQRALGLPTPRYWHIPVFTNRAGEKLSKSSGAIRIDTDRPEQTARCVLALLGKTPPATLDGASPAILWDWAAEDFQLTFLNQLTAPVATS